MERSAMTLRSNQSAGSEASSDAMRNGNLHSDPARQRTPRFLPCFGQFYRAIELVERLPSELAARPVIGVHPVDTRNMHQPRRQ
jgi:hypothetical protein